MPLFEAIQESYPQLSPAKQRLSKYLLENWQEAAFWSAGTLARKAGLSESVVVRFAQDLGYPGYRQIQQEMQTLLKQRLPMARKLEDWSAASSSDRDIITGTIQNDIENLHSILDSTSAEVLIAAADAIAKADRVYVVGLANSAAMAMLLALMLDCLNGRTDHLTLGPEDVFQRISRIGPKDVLISISFPRYMKRTIQATELAVEQQATVVAITDGILSPLSRVAHHAILARNAGVSFAESQAATIGIINVLVNLVSARIARTRLPDLARLDVVYERFGLIE